MNDFYMRYRWLIRALICAAFLTGLLSQVVEAQNSSSPSVEVSAEPETLAITADGKVTVTIRYNALETTSLYFYPPADFLVIDNDGATPYQDSAPPNGLDGSQRIRWDEIIGGGSKTVTLQVAPGASEGEKPYGAALGGDLIDRKSITLSQQTSPTASPPAASQTIQEDDDDLTYDVTIADVEIDKKTAEPGETVLITVIVKNQGSNPVDGVEIQLEAPFFQTPIEPKTIFELEPDEDKQETFLVNLDSSLEDDEYTLSIKLVINNLEVDSKTEEIRVERPLPQIKLINQTVTPGTDGLASLQLVFQNDGGALPDGAKLILRFPPNTLVVQQATINGESSQPELQADGGSYAWANLPAIDGRNGETLLTLRTQLQIMESFSPDATIQSSFIGNSGERLSNGLPLSAANIALLAGAAAQPEPPTPEPEASGSNENATTPDAGPTEGESETPGSGTAGEEDEAGNSWLIPGIIGALLLVAVVSGLLLFMRFRRRATPPFTQTDPTPPTSKLPPPPPSGVFSTGIIPPPPATGQAYLLDSNGRYFPITPIPFTIGRGESNSLIIDESFPQWPSVSRVHAQIIQHPQGYVIEDQGSQNKLRVQGRPTERNLLRNGWKLHVGGVEFTFYDGSTTPPGGAA